MLNPILLYTMCIHVDILHPFRWQCFFSASLNHVLPFIIAIFCIFDLPARKLKEKKQSLCGQRYFDSYSAIAITQAEKKNARRIGWVWKRCQKEQRLTWKICFCANEIAKNELQAICCAYWKRCSGVISADAQNMKKTRTQR